MVANHVYRLPFHERPGSTSTIMNESFSKFERWKNGKSSNLNPERKGVDQFPLDIRRKSKNKKRKKKNKNQIEDGTAKQQSK